MSTYAKAFLKLVPGCTFSSTGDPDVYESYIWVGPGDQPSKAECDAIIPTIQAEESLNAAKRARQGAYQAEADPLYFGWQRGENTEQQWLDKVAEIRARYPYPA